MNLGREIGVTVLEMIQGACEIIGQEIPAAMSERRHRKFLDGSLATVILIH